MELVIPKINIISNYQFSLILLEEESHDQSPQNNQLIGVLVKKKVKQWVKQVKQVNDKHYVIFLLLKI